MAASNTAYDVSDTVRLWATFKAATFTVTSGVPSASYALADPTTVTLSVVSPAGTATDYTYSASVTKSTTGVYYKDLTPDTSGEWRIRWTGTGTVAAVDEYVLYVRDRQVG